MFPFVLCCDCLWRVFTPAEKRPWGLQEADTPLEASSIKACVPTGFLSILRGQSNAPFSPSALLCVTPPAFTRQFLFTQPAPQIAAAEGTYGKPTRGDESGSPLVLTTS